MPKPILIRCGGFSNSIYAVRRYRELPNDRVVSDVKDDVTAQAIQAVIEHARKCESETCSCEGLRAAALGNYHQVDAAVE